MAAGEHGLALKVEPMTAAKAAPIPNGPTLAVTPAGQAHDLVQGRVHFQESLRHQELRLPTRAHVHTRARTQCPQQPTSYKPLAQIARPPLVDLTSKSNTKCTSLDGSFTNLTSERGEGARKAHGNRGMGAWRNGVQSKRWESLPHMDMAPSRTHVCSSCTTRTISESHRVLNKHNRNQQRQFFTGEGEQGTGRDSGGPLRCQVPPETA